jgi:hypothetical protein
MGKYELDLSDVAKIVMPDPNRLPLEENRDRLMCVAFDLFRLKGDNTEDLWQIQADDDGNEFLVRTQALPEEEQQVAKASDWRVVSDAKGSNLTVLYRNIPIQRLAAAMAGASTPADVELLRKTVQEKLSTDDAFVSKFISSIPEEKRDLLSMAGDPLGLGREFRKERKTKEHKKTETEKDIAKILKEVSTPPKKKEQQIDEPSLTDPDTVMEKMIPKSSKEVEEDVWTMNPEDQKALEEALSKLDVWTSTKSSGTKFLLSKRAADIGQDPLLQRLETNSKMLGDVLSEEEDEDEKEEV